MKKPAVKIETHAQAREVISWLYANGLKMGTTVSEAQALQQALDRLTKPTDACDLYLIGPKRFDVAFHPVAWKHHAYTPVNSFTHFKHYLKRYSA